MKKIDKEIIELDNKIDEMIKQFKPFTEFLIDVCSKS
jgi:hypothetical protein